MPFGSVLISSIKGTHRLIKRKMAPSIADSAVFLPPHSFRHSFNTLLRAEDADPAKLRATFGWSSETVQDNHTHWKAEHFESRRRAGER